MSKGIFSLIKSLKIKFTSITNGILFRIECLNNEIFCLMFLKGFIKKKKIILICGIVWNIQADICIDENYEIKGVKIQRLSQKTGPNNNLWRLRFDGIETFFDFVGRIYRFSLNDGGKRVILLLNHLCKLLSPHSKHRKSFRMTLRTMGKIRILGFTDMTKSHHFSILLFMVGN